MTSELNEKLYDIAATGVNDPERYTHRAISKAPTAWDYVKNDPSKFGPEHDFYVKDNVFFAVSEAALNWAFSKLPPDIDRVDVTGFKIEPQWLAFIVSRAKHDRLMSLEDYENAMNELNEISRQW